MRALQRPPSALRPAALRPAALRRTGTCAAVLATSLALAASPAGPAAAAEPSSTVYGDSLGSGWSNWSWGSSVDFGSSGRNGGRGIAVTVNRPWGALYLHADSPLNAQSGSSVQLSIRPSRGGQVLGLIAYGADNSPVGSPYVLPRQGSSLPAGQWSTVRVSLSDLGAYGTVTGLSLQDLTGGTQRFDVDDISFGGLSRQQPSSSSQQAAAPVQQPVVASAPEIRPGNAGPNSARGRATNPSAFFGYDGFRPYYERVNGNYTGTTEEILAWAAAKWGFADMGLPDLAKAVAVVESWWRQETVGRVGEKGILQVNPSAWPDSDPASWSTAYAADYGMAVIRHHYDGNSWLGDATRGSIRNAVSAWECGCGYNGGGWYPTRVFGYYDSKPWQRPGVPPEWF